jgi:hypothetical protein
MNSGKSIVVILPVMVHGFMQFALFVQKALYIFNFMVGKS